MTTCMIFVFAALLEYAIVQWISRKDKDSAFYKRKIQEIRARNDPNGEFTSQFEKINGWLQVESSLISVLRIFSRPFFPLFRESQKYPATYNDISSSCF